VKLQPKEILIDMDKLSLHGLSQFYVKLEESQKTRKLTDLMDILDFNQVIIFVRDKKRAHSLNKILQESKFPSIELHSDMDATDRYVPPHTDNQLRGTSLVDSFRMRMHLRVSLDDGSGWLREVCVSACRSIT
jgi:hypothetical protein